MSSTVAEAISPNAFVDAANASPPLKGGTIKGSALVYGGGEGMKPLAILVIIMAVHLIKLILSGGSNLATGTAKVEISADVGLNCSGDQSAAKLKYCCNIQK